MSSKIKVGDVVQLVDYQGASQIVYEVVSVLHKNNELHVKLKGYPIAYEADLFVVVGGVKSDDPFLLDAVSS